MADLDGRVQHHNQLLCSHDTLRMQYQLSSHVVDEREHKVGATIKSASSLFIFMDAGNIFGIYAAAVRELAGHTARRIWRKKKKT